MEAWSAGALRTSFLSRKRAPASDESAIAATEGISSSKVYTLYYSYTALLYLVPRSSRFCSPESGAHRSSGVKIYDDRSISHRTLFHFSGGCIFLKWVRCLTLSEGFLFVRLPLLLRLAPLGVGSPFTRKNSGVNKR